MVSSRDRKLIILRQLSQESEPVSLLDLLEQLGEGYKERTVRRSLNQLVEEGMVQKVGQKKSTKYIAIQPIQLQADSESVCFNSSSLDALARVKAPVYEREPVAYDDKWFNSYKPNKSFYLNESVRSQLKKAGERANKHDAAGTYAHQIFNRLLIDLSYNSSRLEGCTYSLLDTERLLLHGDAPEGKLDEEKVMILNHKEGIRFLVENAPRLKVSKETIFTIHYLLSDGLVEPKYSGKVRNHGVRISGSTYMPFEDPTRLKSQMHLIAEKADEIKDPFEKSFFLLVHISYIQAFIDVNKRTARVCANIPLVAQNYVPLSFNDIDLSDYRSSIIAIYELQDVKPLADLYVYSYLRTCAAYDATVKAIGIDEVRVRYRQQRHDALRDVIQEMLVGKKLEEFLKGEAKKITLKEHQTAFIEDVKEDLEQMDESRIAGLGITLRQLQEWLRRMK